MLSRKTRLISLGITAVLLASCAPQPIDDHTGCKSAFLKTANLGGLDSVNGLAVAPNYAAFVVTQWIDGKATLAISECKNGAWGSLRPVYPGTAYADYQPTFSKDGERLYFTSTRPITGDKPVRQNVWVASRKSDFAKPTPIKELVSSGWDGHGVELHHNKLLFASERAGGDRLVDIFEVDFTGAKAKISPAHALNSMMSDNDMAYDYLSDTLVFSRYDPNTEDIDLYYSSRKEDAWQKAMPVSALNTSEWELSPAFTPDGEYFLFKRGEGPFQIIPAEELLGPLKG